MLNVRYSIYSAIDPFAPIASDWMTLPQWVYEEDADRVAAIVFEWHIEEAHDEEWPGGDCSEFLLEITAPEHFVGTYHVELELVIKASAKRCDDPRG